jgi:hypothetical protein
MAVDTAKFQGDLGRAASIAESRMRNIRDTATKGLAAFAAVGGALAGVLVASTKRAIDNADAIRDMAAAAGTSAEDMSRLAFAAEKSGADLETVGKAMSKLAAQGAKDSKAALLGLADQMKALEDPTARAALAADALGERLGPRLVPFLSQGSEGIAELAAEADALGVTISNNTADAADRFNDQLTTLSGVARGFRNTLAEALLPTLSTLADELIKTAKNSDSLDKFSRAAATGLKLLLTAGELVRAVFVGLGNALGAVAASLVQVAQGNFRQAWAIINAGFEDVVTAGQESATRILDIWDDAGRQIAGAAAPFVVETETIAASSKKAAKETLTFGESVNRVLADLNADVTNDVVKGINQIANETRGMTTVIEGAEKPLNQMSVFAEEAARNMQGIFADWFANMEGGFKGLAGSFVDMLRQMVAQLLAQEVLLQFFNWGAGLGGKVGAGFSATGKSMGLPGFATGGSFTVGGMGGIDSQLVAFRATPGERVSVSSPGRSIGGDGMTIVINQSFSINDDTDLKRAMPAIMAEGTRQSVAAAKAEIRGDIKRYGKIR